LLEGSKALSVEVRIRPEETRWAKRRSIEIRLGSDARDIPDLELEDFIDEAMIDVKAELDLADIDYSGWTLYSLVPGQVVRATIYGTIEILLARKLESFKTRIVPAVGPMRYEVIERDAMKAINYFRGKKEEALEKTLRDQIGGRVMSTSTIDEEPIFDMKDLEDKVMLGAGETPWFRWLLSR